MSNLSAFEAIERLLAASDKPLHYREIARRIVAEGLWKPRGNGGVAAAASTVNVQISGDIRAHGSDSRFRRVGVGVYEYNRDRVGPPGVSPPPAAPKNPDEPPLAFVDAAERVLKRRGGKRALHYRVITQEALELGLIESEGRTPEAAMYAQLYTEIQRSQRRGVRPRFVRQRGGYFGLTEWMSTELAAKIDEHNREVRKDLLAKIRKMDPIEFEALIGRLLTAIGFDNVTVTRASGDEGVDVRGTLVVAGSMRLLTAVQVKRWRANVQAPQIRELRGGLSARQQGLFITTSDYSPGAREEAEQPDKTPIGLVNGEQLVELLIEHDILVHRSSHEIIELGEDDDEDEEGD